jgi:hypothetical protein
VEKYTIYVRVGGKRHVFRVPPGITLQALLERFQRDLELDNPSGRNIRAAVVTPLGQPLDEFEIKDGSEIVILTEALADEIEYKGTESG